MLPRGSAHARAEYRGVATRWFGARSSDSGRESGESVRRVGVGYFVGRSRKAQVLWSTSCQVGRLASVNGMRKWMLSPLSSVSMG